MKTPRLFLLLFSLTAVLLLGLGLGLLSNGQPASWVIGLHSGADSWRGEKRAVFLPGADRFTENAGGAGTSFIGAGVTTPVAVGPAETLTAPVVGLVRCYRPASAAEPDRVVLFFSGDGGWHGNMDRMAGYLASQRALVVGITTPVYFRHLLRQHRACVYPAAEIEALSAWVQRRYGFKHYHKPLLVGYSAGATLVYALLAQAPTGTFAGGISLGFCPDIELNKPLCTGGGLRQRVNKPGVSYWLEPVARLDNPWCLIQGEQDGVCGPTDAARFVAGMGNAFVERLTGVGHGFGAAARWQPALRRALDRLAPEPPAPAAQAGLLPPVLAANTTDETEPPFADLPLHLTPALGPPDPARPLVLLVSGDGGWTGFDQDLATELARRGLPSVGLDAQQYFWQAKTPAATAAALAPVLRHYAARWQRPRLLLAGYSFGANLLPFVRPLLPPELRARVVGLALVSPTPRADFEIHLADMLGGGANQGPYGVLAALVTAAPDSGPVRCVFGSDEGASLPQQFRAAGATVRVLPGGHHFNNDYAALATALWPDDQ